MEIILIFCFILCYFFLEIIYFLIKFRFFFVNEIPLLAGAGVHDGVVGEPVVQQAENERRQRELEEEVGQRQERFPEGPVIFCYKIFFLIENIFF